MVLGSPFGANPTRKPKLTRSLSGHVKPAWKPALQLHRSGLFLGHNGLALIRVDKIEYDFRHEALAGPTDGWNQLHRYSKPAARTAAMVCSGVW